MKIIDILNKKANGTLEDRFKFKFAGRVFTYSKKNNVIQDEYGWGIGQVSRLEQQLNNTVEVIEKNKEIEELNDTCSDVENMLNTDIDYYNNLTRKKLNELVRAVNKLTKER